MIMFKDFPNYHIATTSKLPLFIIEKWEFVLFLKNLYRDAAFSSDSIFFTNEHFTGKRAIISSVQAFKRK